MLAANEWRKFEESYMKYGVNLAPEPDVQVRRAKKAKEAQKTSYKIKPRDKMIILLLILMMGVCGVALVCLHAYESNINYKIYTLNQEVNDLNGEIDNLNVDLNSYNNLDEIEDYAKENLGMDYPDQDQYIYVGDLIGSAEVNAYMAALAEQQRGVMIQNDYTLVQAARDLFS